MVLFPVPVLDVPYFQQTFLLLLASYVGALIVAYYLPRTDDGDKLGLLGRMDIVHHAGYVPFTTYLAFTGLAELCAPSPSSPEGQCSDSRGRFNSSSGQTKAFLTLYACHCVLHTFVSLLKTSKTSYKVAMIAHHVTSMVSFLACSDTGGYGHFWSTSDGLCEITGIFLNNIFLFKLLKINSPTLSAINGALLWTTWVVFRLMLFPAWLWVFFGDWMAADYEQVTGAAAFPPFYNLMINAFPLVNVLLLGLSFMWFVPIHKGFMKALGATGGGPGRDKERRD
jgi:hypothetical protein